MSSTKQTLVATSADIWPELDRLCRVGALPLAEAHLVVLAYQQREADAEETGRLALPTCLVEP